MLSERTWIGVSSMYTPVVVAPQRDSTPRIEMYLMPEKPCMIDRPGVIRARSSMLRTPF